MLPEDSSKRSGRIRRQPFWITWNPGIEGTAIYKCTNDVPVGKSQFATFEGLPSDYYLKLVGAGGKLLRGELLPKHELPALPARKK